MMLEALHRSLIYSKNSRGPKIDPWGTPHVIFKKDVFCPSTSIYCFLSERQLSNHSKLLPLTPYKLSFLRRI